MIFERTTSVAAPVGDVFAFFSDPKNLARITPAALGFRIVSAPDRALRQGDRIEYRIKVNGVPLTWVTLITAWDENRSFADLQEKGPYRKWLHTHTFEEVNGRTVMRDHVDYDLPFGFPGRLFGGWFVRRQLEGIFGYREKVIQDLFGSPKES